MRAISFLKMVMGRVITNLSCSNKRMKLTINDHHFTTPDSWNDCDQRTALLIHHTLIQPVPREFDTRLAEYVLLFAKPFTDWGRREAIMHHRRVSVFLAITGMPVELFVPTQFSGDTDDNLLHEATMYEAVMAVTAPFFEVATNEDTGEETTTIRYALTKNPFPSLLYKERSKTLKLYGPADGLENLTLYELGAAFHAYDTWIETNNPEDAATLLATLYRPPKPVTTAGRLSNYSGDRRLPLHDHETTVPARARHMVKLPFAVRALLMFWFASCRQTIIAENPVLFKPGKSTASGSNSFGWGGLMLSLADGLVNLDAISKQSWGNAFVYMSFLETRRREQEAEVALRKQTRR